MKRTTPSLRKVLQSVFAGLLGVQSNDAMEEDLRTNRPSVYIAWGIVGTLVFICTLYGIVRWVLALSH